MPLLSVDHLSIAFGAEKLLDDASFQLDAGERVCLIGRNGAGKTTLLRLLADALHADSGEIWRQPGLRIATLAQELPADTTATVFEVVAGGLEGLGDLLADYHEAAVQLTHDHAPEQMRRMEQLQHELEARDGWRWQQRVETVITRLQLPADTPLAELCCCWTSRPTISTWKPSSGWKRNCSNFAADCCSSLTTAPCCNGWRPACWNWIAVC